jgi:hypothetical protein
VGLVIEPSDCTVEPGGTELIRLVDILPSVVVVPATAPEIIAPELVTWEPATGLGTVPGGAITIPVGLVIEPFDCTIDPGGIELRTLVDIWPRVVVVPAAKAEMIAPEALT